MAVRACVAATGVALPCAPPQCCSNCCRFDSQTHDVLRDAAAAAAATASAMVGKAPAKALGGYSSSTAATIQTAVAAQLSTSGCAVTDTMQY